MTHKVASCCILCSYVGGVDVQPAVLVPLRIQLVTFTLECTEMQVYNNGTNILTLKLINF